MKENKKIFEEPKLEVIKFTAQDVIATSGIIPESNSGAKTPKLSMNL